MTAEAEDLELRRHFPRIPRTFFLGGACVESLTQCVNIFEPESDGGAGVHLGGIFLRGKRVDGREVHQIKFSGVNGSSIEGEVSISDNLNNNTLTSSPPAFAVTKY